MFTGLTRFLALLAVIVLFISMNAAAAEQPVNAKTVAEHMDKSKYSASEIKSYLKGLKGGTITADGEIRDIMTGKTGNRVVLSVAAGRTGDFVVDVYVDNAGSLYKGDRVSCTGQYSKYNMFTVNGIALKDGSCRKK